MRTVCHASVACWLGLVLLTGSARAAEPEFSPSWGKIQEIKGHPGCFWFLCEEAPDSGRLLVPSGFPQVISAELNTESERLPVAIEINKDATQIELVLPKQQTASALEILVTTAEKTQQFADGRLVLAADTATVVGEVAKLETHPANHRIGFWSKESDYVSWKFGATRWGMYDISLTYSTAAPDGTEIEVQLTQGELELAFPAKLTSTGSWYQYTTLDIGKVYLQKSGEFTVAVHCKKKVGGAVMNLKAVTLQPTCEGETPKQADDGSILLHGKDATVYGTTLRYEPAEKKQTLGYWVKATDGAAWTFEVKQPGKFEVEVWQGCGKGQGGQQRGPQYWQPFAIRGG